MFKVVKTTHLLSRFACASSDSRNGRGHRAGKSQVLGMCESLALGIHRAPETHGWEQTDTSLKKVILV